MRSARPSPLPSMPPIMARVTPIDGSTELADLLDALSSERPVAARAPRSRGLSTYLASGIASEGPGGEHWRLTEELLTRLSIWWSEWAYQNLPVMVPWAIRDRSARYDQGPENWGTPRADGFFRDDNSIIKKLPLPLTVRGHREHPYHGRQLARGFTACHIWRDLPNGRVGGEDPFIYSFIPNLVWLPTPLAPLTDRHGSLVQLLLQRTSRLKYWGQEPPQFLPYTDRAWDQLAAPPPGRTLDIDSLANFAADPAFVRRRLEYIDRIVAGADSVVRTGGLSSKLISSRYTAGLPRLEKHAVERFRDLLRAYRQAASDSTAGTPST